ncbi:MAG: HD domain-containing protein [Campylobacterales bacterium]|nr:HD domain-containing protein [Campylobacterales bacterium]
MLSAIKRNNLRHIVLILFVVLSIWTLFTYLIGKSVIDQQANDAYLINISGKQRMLSQRTALLAQRLHTTAQADLRRSLNQALELFEQNHRYLMNAVDTSELRTLYHKDGLDTKVQAYLELHRRYMYTPSAPLIEEILDTSNTLLPVLDQAVGLFEQSSRQKLSKLSRYRLLIYSGSFMTLLFGLVVMLRELNTPDHTYNLSQDETLRRLFRERRNFYFQGLWIVLIYLLISGAWIYFSDALLLHLVASVEELHTLQTIKGLLFVLASSLLLALLIILFVKRIIGYIDLIIKSSETSKALQAEKLRDYQATLEALSSLIDSRDSYTAGHSQCVARYSQIIAQEMGVSQSDQDLIWRAGLLHDIGKIAIPDSILLKPGSLSGEEYTIIKEHARIGAEILRMIPGSEALDQIVLCHHERHDGSGYPNHLAGESIPLPARIMCVADSFDAMTTTRIYRRSKSVAEALEELKSLRGKHYHPDVVDAAMIALQAISIDTTISQLPKDVIENERMSYYLKDQLTGAQNEHFIELLMAKNTLHLYHYALSIGLANFNHYNQSHGWKAGDRMLQRIVAHLHTLAPNALLIRYHGDSFILLSLETLDTEALLQGLNELIAPEAIHIRSRSINVQEIPSVIEGI